jgi:hypothetical protein
MSNKAIINVKYVNQPKEGKKQGSIKTDDGRFFGVYPELLGSFSAGTYEIEFKSRDFNGKTYHTVTSAKPVAAPPSSGNGASARSNGTGSTSDQIRWQTCLKVAGNVFTGTPEIAAGAKGGLLEYARALFAADPIVEAAKEIFNATEAPGTDAVPTDW